MAATHPLAPADQVEIAADQHTLPKGRITEHRGIGYVFLTSLTELEAWAHALGGTATHQPAGRNVVLWTLDTHLDHGTPICVQAFALDTDLIDDAITVA